MLTVPAAGTVALNGTTLDQGYRLLNQGTASENTSAGANANCAGVAGIYTLCLAHGSTFENAGTWNITGNGNFNVEADNNAGNAVLNDSGATLTAAATPATNTVNIDAPFTNAGTVNTTAGTLHLLGNATATTDTGAYAIAAGTDVTMTGTRTVIRLGHRRRHAATQRHRNAEPCPDHHRDPGPGERIGVRHVDRRRR